MLLDKIQNLNPPYQTGCKARLKIWIFEYEIFEFCEINKNWRLQIIKDFNYWLFKKYDEESISETKNE